MSTIELTITPNYVDWLLWQGVREFIQNAKDADTKGFNGSMSYDKKAQSLTITNEGVSLDRSSLLLGSGDKKNDLSQIGGYGEGYKLAIATLLSHNKSLTIRTNNEEWTPSIRFSEVFNSNVIAIDILKEEDIGHNVNPNQIDIEINGITELEWAEIEPKFLFLECISGKDERQEFVFTNDYETIFSHHRGEILDLGHTFSPSIYVKGIYISELPEGSQGHSWKFSYNLDHLTVDRDRVMYAAWDFNFELENLIEKFAEENEKGFMDCYGLTMLMEGSNATYALATQCFNTSKVVSLLTAAFLAEYGENAYPYFSSVNAKALEDLGKKPIKVPCYSNVLLCKSLGELSELIYHNKHKFERVELNDLAKPEFTTWEYLMKQVFRYNQEIAKTTTYEVVDYMLTEETDAHYDDELNVVYVGRSLLTSRPLALAATVREACLSAYQYDQKEYPAAVANTLAKMVTGAETCQTSLT